MPFTTGLRPGLKNFGPLGLEDYSQKPNGAIYSSTGRRPVPKKAILNLNLGIF